MDSNKKVTKDILVLDLYSTLGVDRVSDSTTIKKAYYKLSREFHPDVNKEANAQIVFNSLNQAYTILMDEALRSEYDRKSKWGAAYQEELEFLDFEFNNLANGWDESKFEDWKKKNQLNIILYVDENFSGNTEFARWVICKKCGGDGKDIDSKIAIRDENGNVLRFFDGSDGCDFCEGSGLNWKGESCYMCGGKGKVGFTDCKTCEGKKRILGKQKLTKLKFKKGDRVLKIRKGGHFSIDDIGKVGDLYLIKRTETNI